MIYNFPSPFVYRQKVESHKKIKEYLYPLILEDFSKNKEKYVMKTWGCEVYATIHHMIPFLGNEFFMKEVIWSHLQNCFDQVRLSNQPTMNKLAQVWYNYYEPGMFQEVHTHVGSQFSGVYLLHLNEKNTTSFLNLSQEHYQYESYSPDDVDEGEVFIFPSGLPHYVNPVKENRISISFNIHTEY